MINKYLHYFIVGLFVMMLSSGQSFSQPKENGSRTNIKIPKNQNKYQNS